MLTGLVCRGAGWQECAGKRVEGLPAVAGKAVAAPASRASLLVLPSYVLILVVRTSDAASTAVLPGVSVSDRYRGHGPWPRKPLYLKFIRK